MLDEQGNLQGGMDISTEPPSEEEIERAVKPLTGKVQEMNKTTELLKAGGTSAIKALEKIYKQVGEQEEVLDDWLKVIVLPALKKGDRASPNSYKVIVSTG
ncbi:unnamed protein product [Caretta caretta]